MNEEYYHEDLIYELEGNIAQGYCCTSAMVRLFLEQCERENDEMVDAMVGFCDGMYSGQVCGALIGGVMMLSIADRRKSRLTVPVLIRWFDESWSGINCTDVAGEHGERKFEVCSRVICACYMKAMEIMEQFNIEPF